MARKWVSRLVGYYLLNLQPAPGQFPEAETEQWRDFEQIWDEGLASENVQDGEAFAAVRRLCRQADRPKFYADHLPGVLAAVRQARTENYAQGDGGEGQPAESKTKEQAEEASKDCTLCGGTGMVTLFHPDYRGERTIDEIDPERGNRTIAARVVGHCSCDLGRWIRSRCKDKHLLAKIPDVRRVIEGRTRVPWLTYDPTRRDQELPQRMDPAYLARAAGVVRRVDRFGNPQPF